MAACDNDGRVRLFAVALSLIGIFTPHTSAAAACDFRSGGEIGEIIAGFSQAGASAAASQQSFFFDFFLSRPVPFFEGCPSVEQSGQADAYAKAVDVVLKNRGALEKAGTELAARMAEADAANAKFVAAQRSGGDLSKVKADVDEATKEVAEAERTTQEARDRLLTSIATAEARKTGDAVEEFKFFGPKLRWWGNVRLASYPQQVNAPVGAFAADFPSSLANVPVNKLVQAGEFVTGLEYRVNGFGRSLNGNDREERQRFALSIFGGVGATSPLDPNESASVYEVPDGSSPQLPGFTKNFGPISSRYVAFVLPDRARFYRQYSGGVRLTTFYVKKGKTTDPDEPYLAAPAMISASLGRNDLISSGPVARVEAFYPLPLWGDRSDRTAIVYFFGTALLGLQKAENGVPVILKPAPDVPAYDPRVSILQTGRVNRDVYVIGVGLDLTQLLKKPNPLVH